MNVVAIVQARLTSSRLPGKVLLPIGPCEALWHTIVRTRIAVPNTVVAIPDTPGNDALAIWLSEKEVPYWRGPEQDVLLRYQQAAEWAKADVIVRITGDCPFVDPAMVGEMVTQSVELFHPRMYVNNLGNRVHPRGLDVEIFARGVIDWMAGAATLPEDREHVTTMVRREASLRAQLRYGDGYDFSRYRWTLDTIEDYEWFRRIAETYDCTPPHPTYPELMGVMLTRPDLAHYEPADR